MDMMNIEETVEQAKQAFQNGDYKNAVKGFESAMEIYRSEGKSCDAAEMANNLSVVFLKQKKYQRALEIVLGTAEIFEQQNDVTRQAMAIGNQAAALEALKRYEEAEAAYQQSAELFTTAGNDELRGYVLQSLSTLQLRRGRQLEGLLSMKSGLDQQEKLPWRKRLLRWFLKIPFRLIRQ